MSKTYIDGTSCKAINGQFGEFYNMSFNIEKLSQYANEKGYVNMTMSKRREPGQYGDTHYFTLNDWKPEGGNDNAGSSSQDQDEYQTPAKKNNPPVQEDTISVDDLPF